jgi:hypothetical protein
LTGKRTAAKVMSMNAAAKTWDASIIGLTTEDKQEMDVAEQTERAADELNRAADILQATLAAFGEHLSAEQRATIAAAAKSVIRITREIV